jgi:type VI secretion system secreted protein VgrG
MNLYSQSGRPMSLTTPLGQDALLLEELHGTEAVSELFHFRLELLASAGTPVPFDKVVGQSVTASLAMSDGSRRYVNGIVSRFTEGPTVPGARGRASFTRYRAEVVPQLWLLTKRVRSRIFQQKSVPDILKEVLAGLDVDFRLEGQYPERDYCVQYRESDFAFASRLIEDEGICYFFSHRDGGHTLVLADDPQGHPYAPGPSRLHFEPVAGEVRPDDRVVFWEKTQELRAGKCTVWDYAFEMPPKNLGASATPPASVQAGAVAHALQAGGNDKLELYDCPGGYARWVDAVGPAGGYQPSKLGKVFADGERVAGLRMQEETAAALVAAGESTCRQLTAGHKFALDRHGGGDGTYVLTRVEHAASLRGAYTSDARRELDYHNRFACVPLDLPYRPARTTPRPHIASVQTAVVVGPSGKDVFTDKYGRIKVQFFWDRQGKSQGTTRNGSSIVPLQYWGAGGGESPSSSCWVRVAQSWAGRGWGGMVIPRLGQEVVIAFEEGDPDRPLCVGCVYNEVNHPPLPLPERAMDTTLKKSSIGGDTPNFSGLAFHDEPGEEHLQLHSERDLTLMAEQHKVVNVGVNHHVNVGNTHMTTVGALPGGSGGGGGVTYHGKFDWELGNISANVGKSLQLTYGEQVTAVAGLQSPWCFGTNITACINPLAWLGLVPVPIFQALVAPLQGHCNFTIGSWSTLTYGTTFNAFRGPRVELTGKMDPLTQVVANLAAATSTADILVAGSSDPDDKAGLIAGLGGGAAGLLGLLALSEVAVSVLGITKVIDAAAKAGEMNDNVSMLVAAKDFTEQGLRAAGVNSVPDMAADLTALQNHVSVLNGQFATNADTVALQGVAAVMCSAGSGALGNWVSLDGVDPLGGLSLRYGDPIAEPLIRLNQQGIKISVGPPDSGPQITLSPIPTQGLTLSYGPPGAGCSITLNAEGITLKVGATTSITLTPEGVLTDALEVMTDAQTRVDVYTQDLTEIVGGEASRTATSQSYV